MRHYYWNRLVSGPYIQIQTIKKPQKVLVYTIIVIDAQAGLNLLEQI